MKIIIDNRRGLHGYEILDKHECGLVLQGWEVKSARAKTVNLTNSYCFFRRGEFFLYNASFKSWMLQKNDETRERKLLMHKNEIIRLQNKLEKVGNGTILPTKIYFNEQGRVKIEVALVVSLRKEDRRQAIKEKDAQKYIKKIEVLY
ncbi:SsrA-binding protein [Mycoplasmopsis columbinasalis]|uniref:SsrA-binding protein n=1 Tax=Mycoplasmopsis columbinasalis TaxID=114880 RepID=A0A449BAV7_9BACT|nr:SsrA-binding protein [Mycoplasmopsis columbinasalis]VEU78167.1 SsrA RNA (tmRNA)-binding protein [Mycoplasmopsis columbinasalis]